MNKYDLRVARFKQEFRKPRTKEQTKRDTDTIRKLVKIAKQYESKS